MAVVRLSSLLFASTAAWHIPLTPNESTHMQSPLFSKRTSSQPVDRRAALSSCIGILTTPFLLPNQCTAADAIPERAIITLSIPSAQTKVGLKLNDAAVGTRTLPSVEAVQPGGIASRLNIQPGMIVMGYDDAASVVRRIVNGPYPVELKFKNLAAAGDAIGAEGRPIITPKDALQASQKTTGSASEGLITTTLRNASGPCRIQSQRGDILEINYEARIQGPNGPIYDSSLQRGTGQPYQFVIGNGDMIPGVDLGLYDMCPGEIRTLDIPPELAYGLSGSRLFRVPGRTRVWWKVELVRLNFVGEGGTGLGREEMYEGGSGALPVYE